MAGDNLLFLSISETIGGTWCLWWKRNLQKIDLCQQFQGLFTQTPFGIKFCLKIKCLKVLVCLPSQNYTPYRRLTAILQVIAKPLKGKLGKKSLELKKKKKEWKIIILKVFNLSPSALEAHRGNRALVLPTPPQWAQREFHRNRHSWLTSAQISIAPKSSCKPWIFQVWPWIWSPWWDKQHFGRGRSARASTSRSRTRGG